MDLLTPGILFLVCMLLFSAFAKIFTTLSILSVGLGIRSVGFGVVVAGLSLLLSWLVMAPYLGGDTVMHSLSQAQPADVAVFEQRVRPFMEKHVDPSVRDSINGISVKLSEQAKGSEDKESDATLSVLGASFMLTQLKEAFYLGLIFLIPFVVVDLVVTNLMMLLGITQIPALLVSLPVKLLLFISIDGWKLVSERLLNSFIGS